MVGGCSIVLVPVASIRRGPFARRLWFFVGTPLGFPIASRKATTRHQHYSANIPISRGYCFTMLNSNFAMRVSERVTPIFAQPVEIPAPCHVRLRGPTLKLCESFAVCRTRLSLPYVLRSTSLLRRHETSTQHAKVALNRFKTGRTELRVVCSDCTAPLHIVDRAR